MKKSDNPLLSEIQDIIEEKFGLESWPTKSDSHPADDWIDVHVFGEESYIFTIGIKDSKIIIYRPNRDRWGYDNAIDLFNENFLEQLLDQIDELLSDILK